jgi:transposase
MSLRTSLDATIPEETIRVAHAAFSKGHVCMQMRDALGPLYTNAQFASLFFYTGQFAADPARLALILVMQCAAGLSDRQVADAIRGRIDWQYVLALELTDPGCDASTLSEFRPCLIQGEAVPLLLETLLALLQEGNLRKARGKQRTDSPLGWRPSRPSTASHWWVKPCSMPCIASPMGPRHGPSVPRRELRPLDSRKPTSSVRDWRPPLEPMALPFRSRCMRPIRLRRCAALQQ